ncbi:anthranilate synthase component I family protein [Thalassolituus sp. UBA2590]|uniref:anthranilate synthase component I family protein n=1 Tax=Thalassolituus sp. UBA2590 TaxID=1947663 RepID=UPI0026470A82|nr:anthranilate synthase component I family protein [Thalassolituus sp. UBA2590]
MYNTGKELEKNLYFSNSYTPTNPTEWPVMFTHKIELPGANILKNLSQLDNFSLLTIPHRQRHYLNLTEADHFKAKYVLAIDIADTISGFPQAKASKDCNNNGFVAGWVGLLNYPNNRDKIVFRRYNSSLLIDPDSDYCVIQAYEPISADTASNYLKALNFHSTAGVPARRKRKWAPGETKSKYAENFAKVRDYLLSGDCYQINLATPFHCKDDLRDCDPSELLESFDAPHGCIFKDSHRTIISVSPERLLKVTPTPNGNTNTQKLSLETRPIKGTAPRHPDPTEDDRLASSLRESPKNQAENLMIVDLLRNDLSIHAEPGSVSVPELFTLESHSNVHHLVSTITAILRANTPPAEAIKATFPGGSITGAPKKRAMEIINELEPAERGAYCGSMGYIDDSGQCDFNILIRTIEAKEDGATCWGGGGLVIDSDAEDEYQEILNKVTKILETPL